MKKPTFRRRRYFLPGTSQPRLLLTIQIILALLGLVIAGVLYVLFDRDLTAAYFSAHMTISNVRDILLPTLIGIDLAAFVLSALLMLFHTHRIAGPAYRLSRTLQQVVEGAPPAHVQLRKGDYLTELADSVNDLLQALQQQGDVLQQDLDSLKEALSPVEAALSPDDLASMHAALERLYENARRFSPRR
ncbi:MAG: hypothetical protein D6755_13990 [Anaerolineae bacterium]|nr:MAG: hypothetical protein D6755_13990 [Anaerolineae bacterium]